MKPHSITLNKTSLVNQIIITGLLVIITSIILTMFFERIGDIVPTIHRLAVALTWIVLPLVWAGLSLYELKNWSKVSYTLHENSLHINKKGPFYSSSEDLYRYDSIQSVSSAIRMNGDYGTVILRLSNHDDVVLQHVAYPAKQAAKIKQAVNDNRQSTNFL